MIMMITNSYMNYRSAFSGSKAYKVMFLLVVIGN